MTAPPAVADPAAEPGGSQDVVSQITPSASSVLEDSVHQAGARDQARYRDRRQLFSGRTAVSAAAKRTSARASAAVMEEASPTASADLSGPADLRRGVVERHDDRCRGLFSGRSLRFDDRPQGLGPPAAAGRAQHRTPARHSRRDRGSGDLLRTGLDRPAAPRSGAADRRRRGTNWRATGPIISGSIGQSPEAFRADVRHSKRMLEDIGGVLVRGYRAPTFSIGRDSSWAHEILAEEGFRYSSSVYPRKARSLRQPRARPAPRSRRSRVCSKSL